MDTRTPDLASRFQQPKPSLQALGVLLAAIGWGLSLQLLQVSLGSAASNPFLALACPSAGEQPGAGDCSSVVNSAQGYIDAVPGWPKLPVSAFGMAYFAAIGLWFLLIGPTNHAGRAWSLVLLFVVLCGFAASLNFVRIMWLELQRWCFLCAATHVVNGGILAVAAFAHPWRAAPEQAPPHPSRRLVLAAGIASLLLFVMQVGFAYLVLFGSALVERTKAYSAVLDDPAFIRWDYERQPVVAIPLHPDEVFEGAPDAALTAVVFSDLQCPLCRDLRERLTELVQKYPGQIRFACRHVPLDRACNPSAPSGGVHPSACRAARAIEAARLLGGPDMCRAMRRILWANQARLPTRAYHRQSPAERRLITDLASEIGLDPVAFEAALESPAALEYVTADLEVARQLGVNELPTVYLNGKLLRNPVRKETWEAILHVAPADASAPRAPD